MNWSKVMNRLIIVALFLSASTLLCQKLQFDRASFYSYGIRLFSEAHTLPDSSPDSVNVLVLFNISYEALIFVQTNPLDNPGSFQAIPAVEVFFRDSDGITRNRTLWSDTIWVTDYESTKSKDIYTKGFVSTKLLNSDYKCTVQLLDRYRKPEDKNEIAIKSGRQFLIKPIVSDPIFTYKSSKLPDYKFVPFILGNKVNFTASDAKVLIPVSYQSGFNVFNYTITKILEENDNFWNDSINISGRVSPTENGFLDVEKNGDYAMTLNLKSGFKYSESHKKDNFVGVLNIDLPSVQLSPGAYKLSIAVDGKNDTVSYDFDVIWVDMPLALRNPAYAVETMYYILNDEEYDKMNSGDDSEKAKKVMNYWKFKDPTKLTPFNESMTEYFRRVDYAFFNYQTLKEKDGAKTERGKIFILFGKPDKVEKVLNLGKQFEVWTYNKLGKIFHFELVSNGLYILSKIDE